MDTSLDRNITCGFQDVVQQNRSEFGPQVETLPRRRARSYFAGADIKIL